MVKSNKNYRECFYGRLYYRIWSAVSMRIIRFGLYEMNEISTGNFRYHRKTWFRNFVVNELRGVQQR